MAGSGSGATVIARSKATKQSRSLETGLLRFARDDGALEMHVFLAYSEAPSLECQLSLYEPRPF